MAVRSCVASAVHLSIHGFDTVLVNRYVMNLTTHEKTISGITVLRRSDSSRAGQAQDF